jgi:hypothetical protein
MARPLVRGLRIEERGFGKPHSGIRYIWCRGFHTKPAELSVATTVSTTSMLVNIILHFIQELCLCVSFISQNQRHSPVGLGNGDAV